MTFLFHQTKVFLLFEIFLRLLHRAADLTGKGFIKYPTLSNLKDVTANQINIHSSLKLKQDMWRSSNQGQLRIYEEVTKRTKDSELVKGSKILEMIQIQRKSQFTMSNLNHYFESREAISWRILLESISHRTNLNCQLLMIAFIQVLGKTK